MYQKQSYLAPLTEVQQMFLDDSGVLCASVSGNGMPDVEYEDSEIDF